MCLQSAKKMKTQSVSSDKPPEIWSHEPSITQSATEPLIASESSEKTPTASLPPQSQSPPKGTKLNTAMSRQSCRCRAGCGAKKSCICRQLGQPCLPSCHPAISSCSNGRVTSEVGAVVDLDGVKEVKSTATWVIIGNKLDLLPEDKRSDSKRGMVKLPYNVWLAVSPETEVPRGRWPAAYIWSIPTFREGDGSGTKLWW